MHSTRDQALGFIEVIDISGTRAVRLSYLSPYTTAAELARASVAGLGLGHDDALGLSISYRLRLEREARHLDPSELVGNALRTGDRLMLQPSIACC